jgi:hypothetical protein
VTSPQSAIEWQSRDVRAASLSRRFGALLINISCLPPLARLPLIVAFELPMPWSPLRQSLLDWLSGTVVVVENAQSANRPSGHG